MHPAYPVLSRWRRALAASTLIGVVMLGSACEDQPSNPPSSAEEAPGTSQTSSVSVSGSGTSSAAQGGPAWPSADATKAENAKAGDSDWTKGIVDPPPTSVEGFASRASVAPGEPVALYLHSTKGPVVVKAYRTGWYGGAGARLVWTSPSVTKVDQPAATYEPSTRTYSASNWAASTTVQTADWPPGEYVLRLDAASGGTNVVPLTVRSPSTKDALALVNANTTWQAYNHWGGTSLYRGSKGAEDRAYAVSLDRPLDAVYSNAPFNELPLTQLAEKLGLPVAYVTDTDIHSIAHLLDGARGVISLIHDEYYSGVMRDALTQARDGQGTNLAFLGANAVYRHIRLAPTPVGPDRLEIDYKDASLDPVTKSNPSESTSQWRQPPVPRPESDLTGVYYQCNPVRADMVAAQGDNWLMEGTGLKAGDKLVGAVGSEYDQVTPKVPTPRPIEVLFHSPLTCQGAHQFADAAYYTTSSGAGVFATGSIDWICAMARTCNQDQHAADVIMKISTTLLQAFAAGPAGKQHPAHDNLDALNINTTTARDITS